MKKTKIFIGLLLTLIITIPVFVYAVPEKPPGESGMGDSSNVSYTGATTISSSINENNKTYSSTTGSQNAVLVSGGNSTINSCSITKSGDASGDNADFYGTNAAILAYNGGILNIKGGTITTNGSHANAVFAYNKGVINISDATIKTTNNNSGAVMVTGGGILTASNVTAVTSGNSSAPIRSDKGGGTLTVNGGNYTSNGVGSPVIYSTADIIVNNAKMTSTASEGVVIEGKNSIKLSGVTLEATNNKLNGNSETYKTIFIYQSMSGDADVGTSTFISKDSKIINNKGDVIFVTNTNTVITLENNEIVNNDSEGVFLRASTAKWGTSGSNGGVVSLNMINQKVTGDIVIDNISTLNASLKSGSSLVGAINPNNQAKNISLSLSSDSVLSLTADTYVNSLTNELSDNSNIYSNGKYKLYVNGKEVNINSGIYNSNDNTKEISNSNEKTSTAKDNNYVCYIVAGGIVALLTITGTAFIIRKKKND